MNKEASELRIDKAAMYSFHNDEAFVNNVNSILAKNISEQIHRVIETNGEVIIGLTDDKVYEDILNTDQVVFRKIVSWQPLVRCKDCIYLRKSDPVHPDTEWCQRLICGTVDPEFFCADGRRKDDN